MHTLLSSFPTPFITNITIMSSSGIRTFLIFFLHFYHKLYYYLSILKFTLLYCNILFTLSYHPYVIIYFTLSFCIISTRILSLTVHNLNISLYFLKFFLNHSIPYSLQILMSMPSSLFSLIERQFKSANINLNYIDEL